MWQEWMKQYHEMYCENWCKKGYCQICKYDKSEIAKYIMKKFEK